MIYTIIYEDMYINSCFSSWYKTQFRTVLVKAVLSFGPIYNESGTIASILAGGPIARPGPPFLLFGPIIIGSGTIASALAGGPIARPGGGRGHHFLVNCV